MARYIPKIPKPSSSKEELEKALQLHDAMSLARDAEESLVTILEILRNELVPWPSIQDLQFEIEEFERAHESLSDANLEKPHPRLEASGSSSTTTNQKRWPRLNISGPGCIRADSSA